jgi:hypothetical protein
MDLSTKGDLWIYLQRVIGDKNFNGVCLLMEFVYIVINKIISTVCFKNIYYGQNSKGLTSFPHRFRS